MPVVELKDAPKKARDLFEKGRAAMERGNPDYAIDMFLASLDMEPRLLEVRKYLRAAQVKMFKEKGQGKFGRQVGALLALPAAMKAKSLIKKDPAAALRAAEKLMGTDPLSFANAQVLSEAAVALDAPQIGIQALEVVREHDPRNPALLKYLGQLYSSILQPQAARECFEALVAVKPDDVEAVKLLKDSVAEATIQKGSWEGQSFRGSLANADEAVDLERQAKAVKTEDDMALLITEARRKVEAGPRNVNYQRALADYLVRARQFDEAIGVLEKAMEANPGDPQLDRTASQVRVKKFDHLIAEAGKAGQAEEIERLQKERTDFIFADAREKVERYPNDLDFRHQLALQFFQREMYNEAIREFQLAQRSPKHGTSASYHIGQCFKAKGQHDMAMEQFEKALDLLPTMDDMKKQVMYEMGILAQETGDRDRAMRMFKEIYSVDISFRDVADRIDQMYSSST